MDYRIVPITDALIPGFHAVLDAVARERRYLSLLEAPPLDETTLWVHADLKRGFPHFVALVGLDGFERRYPAELSGAENH